MSDLSKKWIGAGLLVLSFGIIAFGCLPADTPDRITYFSRETASLSLSLLPHLSANDLTNRGNADELAELPGVGPATAEAILYERQKNGLFIYAEDLTAVKGIGEKKLGQIRPMLTFASGESEE